MYIVSVDRLPYRLYVSAYKKALKLSDKMSDAIIFPTYSAADLATWGLGNRKIIKLEDCEQ